MKSTILRRAALVALPLLMTAAACGDDDTDAADPGSDTPAADVIRIGYVNNEGGAISLPEYRIGGEVAVGHINDNGGINGATIELVTCSADGSPEGSINCANQLIDEGVAVAYTGIDLASDASLPLYKSAGIPYVSTTGWGAAQRDDPGSFLLHTATVAYAAAPLATLKDLGAEDVAFLSDSSTPAGQAFETDVVAPLAETLDIDVTFVPFELANPDYTQAATGALAADPDGIMAQLDEGGCIGLVAATSSLGFDGPVLPGSCSAYIAELGEDAVGTYIFSPVYSLDTYEYAPEDIQKNLDIFETAMVDAGHEDLLGGFANVPFSGIMELASILETIDGDVTAESAAAALSETETSPGFLGADLHCGAPPIASESSSCRSDYLVFEIVLDDDGTPKKQQVGDGFHDVADLVG